MIIQQAYILQKDGSYKVQDVKFSTRQIEEVADHIEANDEMVIDGKGKYLLPGLIDVHVHLREPGFEHKETIASGSKAAAKGGFTSIFAMPNIVPFPDDVETIKAYLQKIKEDAVVHVYPYACITTKEGGKEVVDMKAIQQLGIKGFSDDGVGVSSDEVMQKAMKEVHDIKSIIVAHTEDMSYRLPKACMHEGAQNKKLGLIGIPSECEYKQIERDLELVRETKANYHICHISAKESVELLRQAKQEGLPVSGEVTTHHLILSDEDVTSPNEKMNPPLKSKTDREALFEGLKDGTIDMIANDHAPHTEEEKAKGMVGSPFGIVGLETSFALLYTYFVKTGKASMQELIKWTVENPAKRFGLEHTGKIEAGYASDLILVDLDEAYTIDKEQFVSKGKNTPFHGYNVFGKIKQTFVDGRCVYKEEL